MHVFLKEYSNSIAKNFKQFLDEDLYVDLIFICSNQRRVKAHQIVLAYLSQFLYKVRSKLCAHLISLMMQFYQQILLFYRYWSKIRTTRKEKSSTFVYRMFTLM